MADFLRHEPCPGCGSRDGLARYDDGSAHCFACKSHNERGDGTIPEQPDDSTTTTEWSPVEGRHAAIKNRALTQETCTFWDYQTGEFQGQACHIANIRDPKTRALRTQKLRLPGKKFPTLGAKKNKPFYGQWLWPGGGRHLVITEGELDALSVSQAFDLKWPVVSLPDGADSAEKAVAEHYEWLEGFDRIVLMFDMDKPGQDAAEKTAALLPVGRAAIATLPEKDANEVLVKHGTGPLVQAFWNAKPWRPDGIVCGTEFTLERLKKAVSAGFALPYPELQEKMLGLRKGELTTLTAGSGIGKSTWARELAYWVHQQHGCSIANVFLEEQNETTAQGYVALHNNVPLGRLRHNPEMLEDAAWNRGLTEVIHQRMWFYDHFGSLESDRLIGQLRYFAVVCKVDFIILDHISIVTSGVESSSEGERKDIDILMTKLASLVQQTGVGIIAIVHLKRAKGKEFNEGSQVSLSDLRGSASIEQLSFNVLALERDQQADTDDEKNRALIRVLKCRETGDTGEADTLTYNRTTGRLELASAFGEM